MTTFQEIQRLQKENDFKEFIILELIGDISAEREDRGISQRELSKISGVPQKTISRLENGLDIPKFSTLFKLMNALDLEIEIKVSKKIQ